MRYPILSLPDKATEGKGGWVCTTLPQGQLFFPEGEVLADVNSFHMGMGPVTDVVAFVCSAAAANNGC